MRGQSIGKTMPHGYAGSYSRQPDCVIDTHPLAGAAINFGAAVVRDKTNTAAVALPSDTSTAAEFMGVAVREVKAPSNYYDQNVGGYNAGDAVPVMKRGCVNVLCQKGTPAAGGKVYVRVKANASYVAALVGGFEADADAANTVELTNCQWKGAADANGIAEIRILDIINA